MYEVADGVGDLPEEVPASVESLLSEVREALAAKPAVACDTARLD
jgi:hypothetical protein